MRISVESLANGEHPPFQIGQVLVRLDGELVKHVIEADSTEGWLIKYVQPFEQVEDYVRKEILYGDVEFEFLGDVE